MGTPRQPTPSLTGYAIPSICGRGHYHRSNADKRRSAMPSFSGCQLMAGTLLHANQMCTTSLPKRPGHAWPTFVQSIERC
ncbi:hypothetical protein D3C75_1303800 [compost metagenome]